MIGGLIYFFVSILLMTSKHNTEWERAMAYNYAWLWLFVSLTFWPILIVITLANVIENIMTQIKGDKEKGENDS